MLLPSDAILMAYADGELDDAMARAIEDAVRSDPALAVKVVGFVRSRRLARAAFEARGLPAPSRELVAEIERAANKATSVRKPARLRREWMPLGIAAAVALVATGALIGNLVLRGGEIGTDGRLAALETPAFGEALRSTPSGQTARIGRGEMRPIATMETRDQRLCREVEVTAGDEVLKAVMCRGDDMAWRAALALAVPRVNAYRPAGSDTLVEEFLRQRGAGPALAGDAELRALNRSSTS